MAVSRALCRLLRIRDLEEEQARLALESALADLHRLEHALRATAERDRGGRRLVKASVSTGELPDRLAGLEETRTAQRQAGALTPRIRNAERDVALLQERYLNSRVERRQAETLIEEAEARDALVGDRRSQQAVDDWFRNRMRQAQEAGGMRTPAHGATDAGLAPEAEQSAGCEET
jgi:hypothetical protein